MKFVVLLDEQKVAYGPFGDAGHAQRFAEFLTAEVDPAKAWPLRDPISELLSWRDHLTDAALETAADITAEVAAHVLFHFGEGGYEAGSFTKDLILLIARADPANRQRLALAHPAYVKAVAFAQDSAHGVDVLKGIAGGVA